MVPLGIPYSTFTGRVVAPGEPQWTAQDQDLALSYLAGKGQECSRCHTREDEWKRDEDAYVVDEYVCEGCGRLDDEQQNIPEGEDASRRYLRGRKTYLRPGHQPAHDDLDDE